MVEFNLVFLEREIIMELIYKGKTKDVYALEDGNCLLNLKMM